jgi:hypothetical protein
MIRWRRDRRPNADNTRRTPAPPPPPVRSIAHRFGSFCPVCGSALGIPTRRTAEGLYIHPPTVRLDVGRADSTGMYPWRFVPLGEPAGPASTNPKFYDGDSEFIYLLCMNGHIFPDEAPMRRTFADTPGNDRFEVDEFRMVAAVGPIASGKTYLTLRMIKQSLVDPFRFSGGDEEYAREADLSPLERLPLNYRIGHYDEMISTRLPIQATDLHNDEGTPRSIFVEKLPNLVDVMEKFLRECVHDGERWANRWGRELRQPLVMRTRHGRHRTWTGIADLPGEQFNPAYEDSHLNARLGRYNAIIWVVDPVVAANATDWFSKVPGGSADSFDKVMEGSLRPGSTAVRDSATIRQTRDRVQRNIAQMLCRVDGMMPEAGSERVQSTLVAITKCDIIHSALRAGTLPDLTSFGDRRLALKGAVDYLLTSAQLMREGATNPDPLAADLLNHVDATDGGRRAARAESVANAILAFYSDPVNFWTLVHGGDELATTFRAGRMGDPASNWVTVPTVVEHLNAWNDSQNPARYLQMRDLVMSIVGCAITYGLGYAESVIQLLGVRSRETRFFLCSPLERVPIAGDGRPTIEPVDGEFPPVGARSAALTQLLLASLGRSAA